MLIEKINLQLFAEDPAPADSNPPAEPSKTTPATPPPAEPKLFSEDYVKSLRSEAAENRVKAKQLREAVESIFGIELDGDITEALTKIKSGYETKLTETQKSVRALHLNTEATKLQAELGIIDLDAAMKLADLSKVQIAEDGKVEGVKEALEAVLEAKPYLKGQPTPTRPIGGNPLRGTEAQPDGVAEALARAKAKNKQGSLANDPWANATGQVGQAGLDPDVLGEAIAKALQGLTKQK
ncbi:MAG TPA: phage scaffolding protein [Thermoclostridium sp.]|nr:phage scaffolding protein [Thermoclostridium sp.]